MAVIREILRSKVKDLTVVAYGGPEIGMLWAAGKLKKAIYGFVSLDSIPQDPYYRSAQAGEGAIDVVEFAGEAIADLGLAAGRCRHLPFPADAGSGSAPTVMTYNPEFKTIKFVDPALDGEVLLAMPACSRPRRGAAA